MSIEYKERYSYEINQELGVKFLVGGIDRPMSDAESNCIREAIDRIMEEIQKEELRLDPKTWERAAQERTNLMSCFPVPIYIEEIPNEYCNRYCCAFRPWFIVTTFRGRIKIGWRKRVIQIDWSGSRIEGNAKDLRIEDDVTMGEKYVHAYGYAKAQEYIRKILTCA